MGTLLDQDKISLTQGFLVSPILERLNKDKRQQLSPFSKSSYWYKILFLRLFGPGLKTPYEAVTAGAVGSLKVGGPDMQELHRYLAKFCVEASLQTTFHLLKCWSFFWIHPPHTLHQDLVLDR